MIQYNNEDWVCGPAIKITSDEQFVPLFVAYQSPCSYNNYNSALGFSLPVVQSPLVNKADIKKGLLDQLNHPYPKQYSLIYHRRHISDINNYEYESRDTISDGFYDDKINSWTGCISMVLPGYLGSLKVGNSSWSLIDKYYAHQLRIRNWYKLFAPDSINPFILILVKAKHIPYLRARLMLKLKFELPFGDMRVLKSRENSLQGFFPSFDITQITNFCRTYNIAIELVSNLELSGYLLGKMVSKTKEEYTRDALAVLTTPELMEPINA